MRETDPYDEMEKALLRMMPVALSDSTQAAMEARIDELAGDGEVVRHVFSRPAKWLGGIAAAVAVGLFAFPSGTREAAPLAETAADDGMDLLTESDRVEDVRDEGLIVDAGGSAVRKMRVRVVGERRIRDRRTGIEVTLTAPREEMYLLPVSTF
jgi:hypothetical protein